MIPVNKVMVSVIVPVYNAQGYLRSCLDSICAQTLTDFEVICVDDGSTDDSCSILQAYAMRDCRFKIIHEQNAGAGAARNRGIQEAQGEYLFFADADDRLSPVLFEKTVNLAEKTSADVVCFGFQRFDAKGKRGNQLGYKVQWLPSWKRIFNRSDCPDRILSIVYPAPWNKLFSRRFVLEEEIRYDEISSSNDITFSAIASWKAEKIATINKALYFHRIGHAGTITETKQKNLMNVLYAVQSTIRQVNGWKFFAFATRSVCFFETVVYAATFSSFVRSWDDPETKRFYTAIHQRFQEEACKGYEDMLRSAGWLLRRYQIFSMLPYSEVDGESRHIVLGATGLRGFPRVLHSIVHLVNKLTCHMPIGVKQKIVGVGMRIKRLLNSIHD